MTFFYRSFLKINPKGQGAGSRKGKGSTNKAVKSISPKVLAFVRELSDFDFLEHY